MRTILDKCGEILQIPPNFIISSKGLTCMGGCVAAFFTAARLQPSYNRYLPSLRAHVIIWSSLSLLKIVGMALSRLAVWNTAVQTTSDPATLKLLIDRGVSYPDLVKRLSTLLTDEGKKTPNSAELITILVNHIEVDKLSHEDIEELYGSINRGSKRLHDLKNEHENSLQQLGNLLNNVDQITLRYLFSSTADPLLYDALLDALRGDEGMEARASRIESLLKNPTTPKALDLIELSANFLTPSMYPLIQTEAVLNALNAGFNEEGNRALQRYLFELSLQQRCNDRKEMPWIYRTLETQKEIWSDETRKQEFLPSNSISTDRLHQLAALIPGNPYGFDTASQIALFFSFLQDQALKVKTKEEVTSSSYIFSCVQNMVSSIDPEEAAAAIMDQLPCGPEKESERPYYNLGILRMAQIYYELSRQPQVRLEILKNKGAKCLAALQQINRELKESPYFASLSSAASVDEQLEAASAFAADKWGQSPPLPGERHTYSWSRFLKTSTTILSHEDGQLQRALISAVISGGALNASGLNLPTLYDMACSLTEDFRCQFENLLFNTQDSEGVYLINRLFSSVTNPSLLTTLLVNVQNRFVDRAPSLLQENLISLLRDPKHVPYNRFALATVFISYTSEPNLDLFYDHVGPEDSEALKYLSTLSEGPAYQKKRDELFSTTNNPLLFQALIKNGVSESALNGRIESLLKNPAAPNRLDLMRSLPAECINTSMCSLIEDQEAFDLILKRDLVSRIALQAWQFREEMMTSLNPDLTTSWINTEKKLPPLTHMEMHWLLTAHLPGQEEEREWLNTLAALLPGNPHHYSPENRSQWALAFIASLVKRTSYEDIESSLPLIKRVKSLIENREIDPATAAKILTEKGPKIASGINKKISSLGFIVMAQLHYDLSRQAEVNITLQTYSSGYRIGSALEEINALIRDNFPSLIPITSKIARDMQDPAWKCTEQLGRELRDTSLSQAWGWGDFTHTEQKPLSKQVKQDQKEIAEAVKNGDLSKLSRYKELADGDTLDNYYQIVGDLKDGDFKERFELLLINEPSLGAHPIVQGIVAEFQHSLNQLPQRFVKQEIDLDEFAASAKYFYQPGVSTDPLLAAIRQADGQLTPSTSSYRELLMPYAYELMGDFAVQQTEKCGFVSARLLSLHLEKQMEKLELLDKDESIDWEISFIKGRYLFLSPLSTEITPETLATAITKHMETKGAIKLRNAFFAVLPRGVRAHLPPRISLPLWMDLLRNPFFHSSWEKFPDFTYEPFKEMAQTSLREAGSLLSAEDFMDKARFYQESTSPEDGSPVSAYMASLWGIYLCSTLLEKYRDELGTDPTFIWLEKVQLMITKHLGEFSWDADNLSSFADQAKAAVKEIYAPFPSEISEEVSRTDSTPASAIPDLELTPDKGTESVERATKDPISTESPDATDLTTAANEPKEISALDEAPL